jgi:carbonic anhydrase/acetyltransferase-like protein (isoleucine patch superfamily)
MPVIPFKGKTPVIGPGTWIAPDAWIIGDVEIGENVSIFFGAVLRGDILPIKVGAGTNIQEGAVLHTSTNLSPTLVGANVTIGHRALIHGCQVQDGCIIGMGSTILDGANIGERSIVGANSLVTMNSIIQPKSLALGAPAKVVRSLTAEELLGLARSAKDYQVLGAGYKAILGTGS